MKRYTVYLVGHWQAKLEAASVEAAEAVALAEAEERWPGLGWLVSDTEEDA